MGQVVRSRLISGKVRVQSPATQCEVCVQQRCDDTVLFLLVPRNALVSTILPVLHTYSFDVVLTVHHR